MNDLLRVLAGFVLGYLLGSVSTAVIVGRAYGKDILEHGSRSAGLTNTLRVLGKTAAAVVLAGDVVKGVLACLIGLWLGVYLHAGAAVDCVSLLAAGAGAVIGHNWSIYFGFKGGKGALTGLTVLFMIDWRMALICLALFVAVVASTRFVSLGTIAATVAFAVLSFVPGFATTLYFNAFACLMAFIVILKHRANVRRLLSGTENKLSFRSA